jgi:3-methyladenine DNA glycosylase/8-oxoguanine DNA glycosylase
MAGLVDTFGPCDVPRRRGGAFGALVRSIQDQQLAGPAAAAIHTRLLALFDGGGVTPEAVLDLGVDRLRTAGLSGAKAASVYDLASRVVGGSLVLEGIGRASDDEIVRRLCTVRGIGEWTAHMFLIFQLGRLDVWPVGDYGVRKGYALAYDLPKLPTSRELQPLGEVYRPYRTLAAWYFWRAVDGAAAPPGW